jgi:hypothetical protein
MRRDPTADRVTFARRVLGIDPFAHTHEALRSTAPVIVGAGGRRSAKTTTSQIAAIATAFMHRDAIVLVTGPNADNVRRYVGEVAAMLRGSKVTAGVMADEQAMRITFPNGSQIIGLPPTAGQVRGYGRNVRMVVIDEAGFCAEGLWRDVRYALLDHHHEGAQAWLIGSPWGEGFFWQAHQRGADGDPDYFAFTWPTALNPNVSRDWIERERARINSYEAGPELDGIWRRSGNTLIPRALIDAAVSDHNAATIFTLPTPARFLLGVDWGVSYDSSAAVAIGRLPVWVHNPDMAGRPVFGVAAVNVWPQGEQLRTVYSEIAAAPSLWEIVTAEINGVGAAASQELRHRLRERADLLARSEVVDAAYQYRYNPHTTSARSKATAYGYVLTLLEQGRLVLPRDPQLLRQLAGLRYDQGERGNVSIQAESAATHDDVADALMLATGPYAIDGRHTTALARYAESERPDAQVSEDVPTVTTGGGLVLPRDPRWQSPGGSDIALPLRAHALPAIPAEPDLITQARAAVAAALAEPEPRRSRRYRTDERRT